MDDYRRVRRIDGFFKSGFASAQIQVFNATSRLSSRTLTLSDWQTVSSSNLRGSLLCPDHIHTNPIPKHYLGECKDTVPQCRRCKQAQIDWVASGGFCQPGNSFQGLKCRCTSDDPKDWLACVMHTPPGWFEFPPDSPMNAPNVQDLYRPPPVKEVVGRWKPGMKPTRKLR